MQQVMDMVQGLQEAMVASKVEQERMQAELATSQARNEELHRTNEELRRGWRDIEEPEQFTPPRGVSHTVLTANSGNIRRGHDG